MSSAATADRIQPAAPAAPAAPVYAPLVKSVGVRRKDPVTGLVYDDGEAADDEPAAKRAALVSYTDRVLTGEYSSDFMEPIEKATRAVFFILQDLTARLRKQAASADKSETAIATTRRARLQFYIEQLENARDKLDRQSHVYTIDLFIAQETVMMLTAEQALAVCRQIIDDTYLATTLAVHVRNLRLAEVVAFLKKNVESLIERFGASE